MNVGNANGLIFIPGGRSFSYSYPHLWNILPEEIKRAASQRAFYKMRRMNPDLIRVELPSYEPPPPWLPPEKRRGHLMYDCDLRVFLPRTVILKRQSPADSLGFHIRGGVEQNCGLFISKVVKNSEADRLGLREGDQVLTVNNRSFENIDHAEAVQILKGSLQVEMTVRYFPYGYKKTYSVVESQSPR